MKKIITLLFSILMGISLVACGNTQTVASTEDVKAVETIQERKNPDKNVTLLVTSDIHGGVEEGFTLAGVYEKRKEYEAKGDYTLLIDDGDLLQGGLLSSMSKGEDLIDIANAAGYDIMTFGNHEFDYGMEKFLSNAKKLNCSYVSCNFNENGKLVFKPYVIKEIGGAKFAFIGINTPDSLTSSAPKYFQDAKGNFKYGFFQGEEGKLLFAKVQESIDNAKAEGADFIIGVAHVGQKEATGLYKYTDIISNTRGFDIFLDGHSHDTDQVNMKDMDGNEVFRMGVGTKLACLGTVTITPAGTIEHELLTYKQPAEGEEPVKYDNVVSQIVQEKNSKIDESMLQKIGTTDFNFTIYDPTAVDEAGKPIRIVRRMETNLGNFVADAYKERTGADCAFVNGGGVRADIGKGDITVSDIKNVQPFGNIICLLEVTGQQILDAMEWGCKVAPAESGAFPQISGMSFDLDTSIENPCKKDDSSGLCIGIEGERRVKNLKINGEDVDLSKKYKMSTLSYMALDHGDGYTAFDGCEVLEMGVAEDYTLILDYIKENLGGKIPENYKDPYGEGRINIIK